MLREILNCRRWLLSGDPFPYFTASSVFKEDYFLKLQARFLELLFTENGGIAFPRSGYGYDAYSMPLTRELAGPFSIFFLPEWKELLAGITGVDATCDVTAGLHHHGEFSRTGTVHNDLNPGWFVDCHDEEGMNVSRYDLCNYFNGAVATTRQQSHEVIRGVTVIYYLCNPDWVPGDGGETGLYQAITDSVASPVEAIPPMNNSLLAFECTPHSYHCFLGNQTKPRNSFIMWLHRPKSTVYRKFGENVVVKWPSNG